MADRPPLPVTIVVPTVGRRSLSRLVESLAAGSGPEPEAMVVVDDRRATERERSLDLPPLAWPTRIVTSGGRGPAAARNAGWRIARTPWIAFLDDDVQPCADWRDLLAADLATADDRVVGSQGRVAVPAPTEAVPDDRWRDALGLVGATWATADMAYRRSALARTGGFDERFPRAYREDTDLGLRMARLGHIAMGGRTVLHPPRPGPWWSSIRAQAGNADDALMRALHGRAWRRVGHAPPGALPRHLATTTAALSAVALTCAGRPRAAVACGSAATAGFASFGWSRRRAPDGRMSDLGPLVATSVAIPLAASGWAVAGAARARRQRSRPHRAPARAVIFDRDGTLVHDVPYNGDPARLAPVDGAAAAVARARRAGAAVAVVTNQSGVARGLLTRAQVDAVNAELDRVVGPFDAVLVCPHGPDDGCSCRKPAAGLVRGALAELGVAPHDAVVIGDIGADVAAAHAAGARAVLVPTDTTRAEEVEAAPAVAVDLPEAVDMALSGAA
jgi:histidinol-phosphate phosphatase family protein